jgi:AmmeMemoRadiSam system protein A
MTKRQLSESEGRLLLRLVRKTIEKKFRPDYPVDQEFLDQLADPVFSEKRGTFVTLTIKGALRGCIGCLTAEISIRESVRCNALYAAFNDHRFRPLAAEELPLVHVEISILTDSEPLSYTSPQELLGKLRPAVDGVILKKDGCCATFLPQVWEQLPDPAHFLSCLCQKAGLSSCAWRDEHPEISVYQVQKFKERT